MREAKPYAAVFTMMRAFAGQAGLQVESYRDAIGDDLTVSDGTDSVTFSASEEPTGCEYDVVLSIGEPEHRPRIAQFGNLADARSSVERSLRAAFPAKP